MKNQNETSAEDIATVPNKIGTFKRKLLRLAEVNLDDTDDVAPVTKHELHDILSNLDVDEQSLVLSVVNDCCENNFEIFDDLVSFLATCDDDAFTEISDVILNLLGELETFYDTYDEPDVETSDTEVSEKSAYAENSDDTEDTVDEKLINIAHTRDLRRQRAKSLWKRNAVLRARFRKTAQGKREKKAAKLYLKRYRKANKTRLKRYAQEYAKDLAKKAKK